MTHGSSTEERQHDVDMLSASSSTAIKPPPVVEILNNNTTIQLTKDEYGFGFNVVGGLDSQHLPGESGIFVSLIKEDGVAERDGRLKQGDMIVSVNGVDLTNCTHDDAVKILRQVKETATLVILPQAEQTILSFSPPLAASPFRPPEDPKPKINGSPSVSLPSSTPSAPSYSEETFAVRGALFGQATKKKDEDEESLYAPSTHSIIDDVPRTPKKKRNLFEKATPFLTEAAYVGIGLAVISASLFLTYKFVTRRRI